MLGEGIAASWNRSDHYWDEVLDGHFEYWMLHSIILHYGIKKSLSGNENGDKLWILTAGVDSWMQWKICDVEFWTG